MVDAFSFELITIAGMKSNNIVTGSPYISHSSPVPDCILRGA